jgi:hypoxia up-regulated 1
MWNWSMRLFLQEARENVTVEAAAGLPSKWTKEELDGLEKVLREHEAWLHEWVEKQKGVKMNEDPVIETAEMKVRARVLEQHLMKLVKRKVPKVKKPDAKPSGGGAEGKGKADTGNAEAPKPPPGHEEL